jgi:hypothetical protein
MADIRNPVAKLSFLNKEKNMEYIKKAGFIFTTTCLMFFIACGGDYSNDKSDGSYNSSAASVAITRMPVKVYVGESKTIPVTARNTDFTVSAAPSGSGCVKNERGDGVFCAPAAAGTYTVTVTATADAAKEVKTTVNVPELEFMDGEEEEEEKTLTFDTPGSMTITFNAASEWTATVADNAGNVPDWIAIESSDGAVKNNHINETIRLYAIPTVNGNAGTSTITVTVSNNAGGGNRQATIILTTQNGRTRKIAVIQYPVVKDPNLKIEFNTPIWNVETISRTPGRNTLPWTAQNESLFSLRLDLRYSDNSGSLPGYPRNISINHTEQIERTANTETIIKTTEQFCLSYNANDIGSMITLVGPRREHPAWTFSPGLDNYGSLSDGRGSNAPSLILNHDGASKGRKTFRLASGNAGMPAGLTWELTIITSQAR